MKITQVYINLASDKDHNTRIKAYASLVFDDTFCVRDLKVVEGERGTFVSMPSRKLTDRCPSCSAKVPLVDQYCGKCGHRLGRYLIEEERIKLHVDVFHPINSEGRADIREAVLAAYEKELHQ